MKAIQQAREGLLMYMQANQQFIDEKVYNQFNVECIQQRPLKELDLNKMVKTIKELFDFASNKQYDYFYAHLKDNVQNYIKEQYSHKAVQSFYTLDLQKLTDIIKFCIKNGFDTSPPPPPPPKKQPDPPPPPPKKEPPPKKQSSPPPPKKKEPPPPPPKKERKIPSGPVEPIPAPVYKPSARAVVTNQEEKPEEKPKDQYPNVKPKTTTHIDKDLIPEKSEFKIEKHQVIDTTKAKPKISTFLDKDKIPQKKPQFKIEKFEVVDTTKAKPKISTFLDKDKIPEKKAEFKIEKHQMPQTTNVGPKYLANLPKKVIVKEQQPLPVVQPLDDTYLLANKKAMRERLQKLFNFYCVQGQSLGAEPTFDKIKEIGSSMNLGRFMQFCKYTRVFECKQMNKDVLMSEFKKRSSGKLEIDFDNFEGLLAHLDQKYQKFMKHDPQSNPIPTYQARLMLSDPRKLGEVKKHRHLAFHTRNLQPRELRSKSMRYEGKELTLHSGRIREDLQIELKERAVSEAIPPPKSVKKVRRLDDSAIQLKDLAKLKLPPIAWLTDEDQDRSRLFHN